MKRGFMDFAVDIIKEYPGLTAGEVAREALDFNSDLSDSKDPVQSLASTLNKQVQTGLEKRIRREHSRGVYRYFLTTVPSATDSSEEIVVQFSLPAQELKDIDNLVALEKVHTRSDAIKWLVLEGIEAKRSYLDKLSEVRSQIERLKKEVAEE